MQLTVEDVRPFLRVSGDTFDAEIEMYMEAAIADMKRVGINDMTIGSGHPMVNTAIICYCKSLFGFDNPDSDAFMKAYRQYVCDLLNSSMNEAAVENTVES